MDLMTEIRQNARQLKKTIVLPEAMDSRMLKAASQAKNEGLANIVLLGNADEINKKAAGLDLEGITIINPEKSDKSSYYVDQLVEIRKKKGMTHEKAAELIKNPLYYGAMMVKLGDADGMVAGAVNTTGDVLRPALQIIKTAPGISVVSSCFIMQVLYKEFGHDGVLLFADCAVNPSPTAEQLASIAVTSANTAKSLIGMEPKVAMLSFSTKGSAQHELVDKVVEATKLAKEMAPDVTIDGEIQADAALVKEVGSLKCPGSSVAGKANVLVFPDLQAANIGYKLVQRLGKAEAIGPVCQGMAKPVNDLSRGCSVEDVVNVIAITAVQAQNL
ncbi:phosphate acetyltransferase [Xylanivirga thermophila]|uniref:phosphate acetyltransferase n=1 Tax=Xylanivirga thermophila TaxID=2496273 RepID=UPI00101D9510|nr:phosphate acetyltransferase [Xylanivirga thermophila]